MIRQVKEEDAEEICAIYNYYIEHTTISFEEMPLTVAEMAERIHRISAMYPYIVWEEDGAILGYAYVTAYHERSAYRHSVSDTIYLRPDAKGRGIGKALITELLDRCRTAGIHAVVALITHPNEPSIALHQRAGFKKVAHMEEIGYKFNQWLDVEYWERLL
jgi:phosphinothricin acetyltransferase